MSNKLKKLRRIDVTIIFRPVITFSLNCISVFLTCRTWRTRIDNKVTTGIYVTLDDTGNSAYFVRMKFPSRYQKSGTVFWMVTRKIKHVGHTTRYSPYYGGTSAKGLVLLVRQWKVFHFWVLRPLHFNRPLVRQSNIPDSPISHSNMYLLTRYFHWYLARLENYANKLRDIVLLQTEGEKLCNQSRSIFNKRMEWPIEHSKLSTYLHRVVNL